MCRFALYLGSPIKISALVTEPDHSLVCQSSHSREREEPLNGDGFGIGWFAPHAGPEPAIFRSVSPAWSNVNLRHLARVTESHCILAHVRAASPGLPVSELNCHPFDWGPFAFMHNGYIPGFKSIRRDLLRKLSEHAFQMIEGSTDSEHIFGLFIDHFEEQPAKLAPEERMAAALEATIHTTEALRQAHGITEGSQLNLAVTDGEVAVVSRYATPGDEPPNSLYLNRGKRYVCEDGVCYMLDPEEVLDEAVLIASEPLSEDPNWEHIPPNHIATILPDRSVQLKPIATPDVG